MRPEAAAPPAATGPGAQRSARSPARGAPSDGSRPSSGLAKPAGTWGPGCQGGEGFGKRGGLLDVCSGSRPGGKFSGRGVSSGALCEGLKIRVQGAAGDLSCQGSHGERELHSVGLLKFDPVVRKRRKWKNVECSAILLGQLLNTEKKKKIGLNARQRIKRAHRQKQTPFPSASPRVFVLSHLSTFRGENNN